MIVGFTNFAAHRPKTKARDTTHVDWIIVIAFAGVALLSALAIYWYLTIPEDWRGGCISTIDHHDACAHARHR